MRRDFSNWRLYQIYPQSFQDTNDDGIGDLNGIAQHIPYLEKLGINAVWLNPIFVSPQIDHGYDVSDFMALDPRMGTMADFNALIAALHRAGIRLILDLPLNHTSKQHPWFQAAVSDPTGPMRDFYLFAGKNGQRPNNWANFAGESVWALDPSDSGAFYFHLFDRQMPDLNWGNPAVIAQMVAIAKYWLAQGVDGFRLDAFIHIAKASFSLQMPGAGKTPRLAERFFANLPAVVPRLWHFVHALRAEFPNVFLLGEGASTTAKQAARYLGDDMLDALVSFRAFPTEPDALPFHNAALNWPAFVAEQNAWQHLSAPPVLYWSNHDMPRLAERVPDSPVLRRSLAIFMYLQRGLPLLYYGEELGLHNLRLTAGAAFEDPAASRFIAGAATAAAKAERLELVSRSRKMAARGPMPWRGQQNFGFSPHDPWLQGKLIPVTTVEAQAQNATSMLRFYQRLMALKQTPLFTAGSMHRIHGAAGWYVYGRVLGVTKAHVYLNVAPQPQTVTVASSYWRRLFGAGTSALKDKTLTLGPYASIVLTKGGQS